MLSNEEDEEYVRGRKKTVRKKLQKFGLNKEFIIQDDITHVFEKMKITIDNEEAKKIFQDLDIDKTGQLQIEKFVEAITLSQKSSTSYSNILKQINEGLITVSERIMIKLKKMKHRATFSSDTESLEDIDWIITALSDDIYEPEIDNLLRKSKDMDDNAIIWLSQTSNAQSKIEREKDQEVTSREQKRMKTLSFFRKSNSSSTSLDKINLIHRMSSDIKSRDSSTLSELSLSIMGSVKNNLESLNSFGYNIFELDDLIEKKTLFFIAYEIFNNNNYFDELLDEKKFKNFMTEIIIGYDRKVKYHNDLHAGDVLQTTNLMIEKGELIQNLNLNDVDVAATLLAAMCHDFKHNGYNNLYHINDKSNIAITYNDISVLENYHVAESFKVMMKEDNNLLCKLNLHQWRHVRRRMIDCILYTDMANHAKHFSNLKTKMETYDIKKGENLDKMIVIDNNAKTYENQQLILGMCLHSADISNPAKPADINSRWIDMLFIEFFNQGDAEKIKSLPVSMLCDRDTTNINKSQIAFIQFVVAPTYETMINFMPKIAPYYDTIQKNLKRFESLVTEDEERKK